jgi:hypothetical protein
MFFERYSASLAVSNWFKLCSTREQTRDSSLHWLNPPAFRLNTVTTIPSMINTNPPPIPSSTVPTTMETIGLLDSAGSTTSTGVTTMLGVLVGGGKISARAGAALVDGNGVSLGGARMVGVAVRAETTDPLMTGIESIGPFARANSAEIHPRALGFVGSGTCHQSLAGDRPTICTVSPFFSCPITAALVEGDTRIRRFSFVVAVTPDTGVFAGERVDDASGVGEGAAVAPLGGIGVFVGGCRVAVGGTGVFVGGTRVFVGVGDLRGGTVPCCAAD